MESTWQDNKLYILLLSRGGGSGSFQWISFFKETTGGYVFHAVDSAPGGYKQWRLEREQSLGVYGMERLVAALEVGDDVQGLRSAIDEATNEVWAKADTNSESFCCRKFLMDCLAEFDQRGIIAITGTITQVQEEALAVAMMDDPSLSPIGHGRRVYKSRFSK
ncbi:hypothetical protein FGG08_004238 [Glutinoglossum americanum]|uniref:Uncharacterized protein n=1 Tax=Glutinoglossum americanum TaxID=1670608 RepID=A0A9P8L2Y6_9PEZI|nr:hypothetical protein FGG08_004238 [Glutinoglossum americanum]